MGKYEVLDLIKEKNNGEKAFDKIIALNDLDIREMKQNELEDISSYVHNYLEDTLKNVAKLIGEAEGIKFDGVKTKSKRIASGSHEEKTGQTTGGWFFGLGKKNIMKTVIDYTDINVLDENSINKAFKEVAKNFKNVAEVEKIHSEMIRLMMFLNRLNPSITALLAKGIANDIKEITNDIVKTQERIKELGSSNNKDKEFLIEHEEALISQKGMLEGISGQISAIGAIAEKVDIEKFRNDEQQAQLDKEAEINKQQQDQLDKEAEINKQQQDQLDKEAEINKQQQDQLDKEAEINKQQQDQLDKEAKINKQQQDHIDRVNHIINERKSLLGRLKIYLPSYLALALATVSLAIQLGYLKI